LRLGGYAMQVSELWIIAVMCRVVCMKCVAPVGVSANGEVMVGTVHGATLVSSDSSSGAHAH
jgi:hypothetical protein